MMKTTYIITGAAGHLGSTLVRLLLQQGEKVRGLLLPGEEGTGRGEVTYIRGDVRDKASLRPLFEGLHGQETVLIHCAGIVSIAENVTERMKDVNIGGTQNIIDLCKENAVRKLVYVSSVHAIPEGEKWRVISETDHFSGDWVTGGYAKTKAEATQRVLDAGQQGLNLTVVHPSGILGPYDNSGNHLVQFVKDYVLGRLPAGVCGGYDFVDVRDVAQGCLAASREMESGNCYILSNRHYDVREVLAMIRAIRGGRRIPILPVWIAKAAAPLLGWIARLRHERPLYTRYSLYTLSSNDRFSHDKATRVLGYQPRDLYDTLSDTIRWVERGEAQLSPSLAG